MKREIKLLPCPFCGGEVKEVKPAFNIEELIYFRSIAHAKCEGCEEEWGHCGSLYEFRFEKWNRRYDKNAIHSPHTSKPLKNP